MHGAFFLFTLPATCYSAVTRASMISVDRRHLMSRIASWLLLFLLVSRGGSAGGEEPVSAGEERSSAVPRYETPLAGEACSVSILGRQIDIPARDRRNTLALNLGGTLFLPALGSSDALPMGALYWRRENPGSRTRLVFSVFYNELDHALKYDKFELLAHLENMTIPFPSQEIVGG